MIADPKEQRTEALNERVDTRGLGYRLNELSCTISTTHRRSSSKAHHANTATLKEHPDALLILP